MSVRSTSVIAVIVMWAILCGAVERLVAQDTSPSRPDVARVAFHGTSCSLPWSDALFVELLGLELGSLALLDEDGSLVLAIEGDCDTHAQLSFDGLVAQVDLRDIADNKERALAMLAVQLVEQRLSPAEALPDESELNTEIEAPATDPAGSHEHARDLGGPYQSAVGRQEEEDQRGALSTEDRSAANQFGVNALVASFGHPVFGISAAYARVVYPQFEVIAGAAFLTGHRASTYGNVDSIQLSGRFGVGGFYWLGPIRLETRLSIQLEWTELAGVQRTPPDPNIRTASRAQISTSIRAVAGARIRIAGSFGVSLQGGAVFVMQGLDAVVDGSSHVSWNGVVPLAELGVFLDF